MNKNAIIVSGPTSSGKTTLIKSSIFKGFLKKLLISNKNFSETKSWDIFSENFYDHTLKKDNVIYHYDFLKRKNFLTRKYDYISKIFNSYENIYVIVCVTSQENLLKRYYLMEKYRTKKRNFIRNLRPRLLIEKILIPYLYKNNLRVYRLYLQWMNFLKKYNVKLYIYNSSKNVFGIESGRTKFKNLIETIIF